MSYIRHNRLLKISDILDAAINFTDESVRYEMDDYIWTDFNRLKVQNGSSSETNKLYCFPYRFLIRKPEKNTRFS